MARVLFLANSEISFLFGRISRCCCSLFAYLFGMFPRLPNSRVYIFYHALSEWSPLSLIHLLPSYVQARLISFLNAHVFKFISPSLRVPPLFVCLSRSAPVL